MGLVLFGALVLAGLAAPASPSRPTSRSAATSPTPSLLEQIELPEQSVVYDRTGKIELARFGEFNREVVTFDRDPAGPRRRDHRRRGPHRSGTTRASTRSGSSPPASTPCAAAPRGASTITQQLVRQRLLTDERHGRRRSVTATPQAQEIIQSIRVTQAYPGRRRQAADHGRLPQPELLRQRVVRRRGRREGATSACELKDLTLAQAAILAALPKSPSTYDLVQNAVLECLDPARGPTETCDEVPARRPGGRARSSSAATSCST